MNAWRAAADAVLVLHAAVVLFVVGGLVLVLVGNLLKHPLGGPRWPWVNRPWFRVLHGAAIDPDLSVAKVSRREVTATEAERAGQRAAYLFSDMLTRRFITDRE